MDSLTSGLTCGIFGKLTGMHQPMEDDEYFKPLIEWQSEKNQDFFLGLIHEKDGFSLIRLKYYFHIQLYEKELRIKSTSYHCYCTSVFLPAPLFRT